MSIDKSENTNMTDEENYKKLEELSTKLFLDYKYMYEYNIALVKGTAGWRKEKQGLVNDLTDAQNKIRELEEDNITWFRLWIGTVLISALTTVGLICLL